MIDQIVSTFRLGVAKPFISTRRFHSAVPKVRTLKEDRSHGVCQWQAALLPSKIQTRQINAKRASRAIPPPP